MNKPFLVFDREQNGLESMNSRIDTLLRLFNMKDRYIKDNNIINIDNIDFSNVKKIQYDEKKRSINYLKKALNIE